MELKCTEKIPKAQILPTALTAQVNFYYNKNYFHKNFMMLILHV